MKLLLNTNLLPIVAITLIFSFLTGCGTDHDDHGPTPVGLELSVDGTVLATQDGRTVTYPSGDSIELNQGATLGPIEIEFIAEGGERYQPDTNAGYSLEYNPSNSNIISLGQGTSAWSIQLAGSMAGESTITFELMHNGHADFESQPFQVRIISVNTQN